MNEHTPHDPALTVVVLASALKRLGLLEETYGFTRLRFAAHAACVRESLRRKLDDKVGVAGFNLARARARAALSPERCAEPRTRTVR